MKLKMLAAAMCLTGMATAQTIDWNNDLMAGFEAAQKDGGAAVVPAPKSSAGAARSSRAKEIRPENVVAEAVPQKTGEISGSFLGDPYPVKYLIVNNAKDKVGGTFTVCEQQTNDDGPNCETISFAFPQLRYDAENKRIVLGDELVATNGWFRGIQLSKSFKLAAKVEDVLDTSGFDRVTRHFVKLYLVRTGL